MGFADMNVIKTLFCRNAFVNNMQKKVLGILKLILPVKYSGVIDSLNVYYNFVTDKPIFQVSNLKNGTLTKVDSQWCHC